MKPHVSNKLPGDTGASGHGPQFERARLYRAVQRGVWAGLPSLQSTVVWFGDQGVEGTMVRSQETRI